MQDSSDALIVLYGSSHLLEFGNFRSQGRDFCSELIDFGRVTQRSQGEVGDLSTNLFTHLALENFRALPDMLRKLITTC